MGRVSTFRVQLLVHFWLVLLEPFFALLRCAAKLAILGWWISPDFSAPGEKCSIPCRLSLGVKGTSGGREQTAELFSGGCGQGQRRGRGMHRRNR